jgi:hypothetical protein
MPINRSGKVKLPFQHADIPLNTKQIMPRSLKLTKIVDPNFGTCQRYWHYSLFLIVFLISLSCENKQEELPAADVDNGGLIIPGGFEALVVIDSAGPTRHILTKVTKKPLNWLNFESQVRIGKTEFIDLFLYPFN